MGEASQKREYIHVHVFAFQDTTKTVPECIVGGAYLRSSHLITARL